MNSEGTLIKQTFGVEKDPIKHFFKKLNFRGKLQNLGFLRENLKVKNAYLWDFSAKNEKKYYVFRKEMKSLLYKSVLKFGQKCIDTKLQQLKC